MDAGKVEIQESIAVLAGEDDFVGVSGYFAHPLILRGDIHDPLETISY